jgi:hypothetical protein
MRYFLTHNKTNVFHYGHIHDDQKIETGQPFLEYFISEELLINRLNDLGQDYVQSIINGDPFQGFETFEEPSVE